MEYLKPIIVIFILVILPLFFICSYCYGVITSLVIIGGAILYTTLIALAISWATD